jgi:hypothetical protein
VKINWKVCKSPRLNVVFYIWAIPAIVVCSFYSYKGIQGITGLQKQTEREFLYNEYSLRQVQEIDMVVAHAFEAGYRSALEDVKKNKKIDDHFVLDRTECFQKWWINLTGKGVEYDTRKRRKSKRSS